MAARGAEDWAVAMVVAVTVAGMGRMIRLALVVGGVLMMLWMMGYRMSSCRDVCEER